MRKNLIAQLKEYEAKTSHSRQDKYRKRFVKTVYCEDKENINPNVFKQSSKKKKEKDEGKAKASRSHNGSRVTTEGEDHEGKGERMPLDAKN
jgi:hypothetical protein